MANVVEVTILAKDEASGPIKGVGSALGELEGKGNSAGGAMGGLGNVLGTVATVGMKAVGVAAVTVVAGIGAAVNTAADFQSRMSGVGAVAGASATELAGLSETALQLGMDTTLAGVSASDAATAMEQLASGGVSVADIMGGAAYGALQLASAGGIGVGEAAGIAALALKDFNLSGTDMAHVADLFAAAANSSAVTVTDLGESLKYVGPVASTMGISLEELTGTLAELGDKGIKGSEAGTALRGMITNLAAPTAVQTQVMKDLNLQFFDSDGKMRNVAGIAQELHDKLGGLTDQQRTAALATLFGNEGLTAAQILYDGGAKAVQDYTDKVNVSGAAAANGAARNDNLKGALAGLSGVWETLTIKVGTAFIPAITAATQGLTGFLTSVMPVVTAAIPGLIAGIERVIGVAVRFGTDVVDAVRAVVGAFQSLFAGQINFGQFAGGIEAMVTSILGHLGALAARAAPYIGQFFSAIGTAITTYGPQVAAQFQIYALRFVDWIQTTAIPFLAPRLTAFLSAITTWLSGTALPAIGTALSAVGTAFGDWVATRAVPWVRANLPGWVAAITTWVSGTAVPAITAALVAMGTAFGDWVATKAVPWVKENLPGWIKAVTDWINAVALPALTTAVEVLAGALVSWIKGEGAAAALGAWKDAVIGGLGEALAALDGFTKIAQPKLSEWIKSEETRTKFKDLAKAVGDGSADILNALNDFSNNAGVRLNKWLEESGPRWLVSWQALGEVVKNGIEYCVTNLIPGILHLSERMNAWADTVLPKWLTDWGELGRVSKVALEDIVTGVIDGILRLSTAMNAALDSVLPKWLTDWGELKRVTIDQLGLMVQGAITAMINLNTAMVNGLEAAKAAVAGAVAGFPGAVLAIGGAMFSAGASIIGQLGAGIESAIGAAIQKVRDGLSQISNMLPHSEPRDPLSPLRGLTDAGMAIFTMFGEGIALGTPAAVKAAAEAASAVAKAITDTLGALRGLGAFDPASGPTAGQLGGFTTLVSGVIAAIQEAAAQFTEKGLKAATDFADAGSKVFGLLKAALDGIKGLPDLVVPTFATVHDFALTIGMIVQELQWVATAFTTDGLTQGSAFADAAGKILGVVTNGLAAIKALATGEVKDVPFAAVHSFALSVAMIVQELGWVATFFKEQGLTQTAVFADTAGKVLGLIANGVKAIQELPNITDPGFPAVHLFATIVGTIVQELGWVASQFKEQGLAQAAAFATAGGTILGMISNGVAGIMALNTLVEPSKQAIDNFLIVVFYIVGRFADAASRLSTEGIKATTDFSVAAQAALAATKEGTDAFKAFEKLVVPSKEAIDHLVTAINYVVQQIGIIAGQMTDQGIARTNAFATMTQNVVKGITDTMDLFKKLMEAPYKTMLADGMKAVTDQMNIALGNMQNLSNDSSHFLSMAENFADNMRAAAAAIRDGLAAGAAAGGASLPSLPSGPSDSGGTKREVPHLAAGGVVTRPTFALIGESGPEAVVPLGRAGVGGGGDTYHFHFAGSLVTESQAVDMVYQGLLKKKRANTALGLA